MMSSAVNIGCKLLKVIPAGLIGPCINSGAVNLQLVRYRRAKHWNPKFKKLRKLKFVKVDLPDYHEDQSKLSEEEIRSRMKEKGVLPPRPWMERPFYVSCTGGIFEPYVPPEGDGKMSAISKTGAKQTLEFFEKKSKSMMAVRKIRTYEEDFNKDVFAAAAHDIYILAHTHMCNKEELKLQDVVTERAYPEILRNAHDKTIHWKFLKSLEPPRVVHARCTDIITKDNIFGQLTVRFHTQQVLAVYDRFGRLMHGSEIIAKDVLEYVVFEKHLSNQYGQWRLHDKIIPDWMPPREPSMKTYTVQEIPATPDNDAPETKEVVVTDKNPSQEAVTSSQ